MSLVIKHEGPRVFNVYDEVEPNEFEFVEAFKTNHSAKKFLLAKGQEADQHNLSKNVPTLVQHLGTKTVKAYLRAMKSKSRKASIRVFCLMCVGGLSKEVALCSAKDCPLYKFRISG